MGGTGMSAGDHHRGWGRSAVVKVAVLVVGLSLTLVACDNSPTFGAASTAPPPAASSPSMSVSPSPTEMLTTSLSATPTPALTNSTAEATLAPPTSNPPAVRTTAPAGPYYVNCAAVEAAGKAPLYRGQPGYRLGLDRDGDGVACEQQAAASAPPTPTAALPGGVYYANCAAARAAGVVPLHRGEPGYRAGLDRDGDGVACE